MHIVATKKTLFPLIRPIGINIDFVAFFMDFCEKREKAGISKLRGLMIVTGYFYGNLLRKLTRKGVYFRASQCVHPFSREICRGRMRVVFPNLGHSILGGGLLQLPFSSHPNGGHKVKRKNPKRVVGYSFRVEEIIINFLDSFLPSF